MPWFKADDGLSMKVETTRIPRNARTSAIGLWVLAGSWSARELTDGHIPAHMLDELAGTPEDAGWLVTAGFWTVVDDGWRFVDWEPDQPLRAAVLAERAKKAEKMRGWRARNQASNPATEPTTSEVTDALSSPAGDLAVTAAPTRTQSLLVQPAGLDSHQGFEEFWEVFPRREAKKDAAKAYAGALKTADATTILEGARRYALLRAGEDRKFTKLPAGWLRGEQWANEPPASEPTRSGMQTPATCVHEYPTGACPYCEEQPF